MKEEAKPVLAAAHDRVFEVSMTVPAGLDFDVVSTVLRTQNVINEDK